MPAYLLNVPDPEPAIKSVDPHVGRCFAGDVSLQPKGEVVFKHFGRIKADELRAAIEKVMST